MLQQLRQIVENILPEMGPILLGKLAFNTFIKNQNFYRGFMGNRLGQNDRNDRGIISGVRQKIDFDPCFTNQSQCFPEHHDFHFLCLNNIFLFGGQVCEAFFLNIEYNPSSFLRTNICSRIFIELHGFSKMFHRFPCIFIDFQRFL